MARPTIDDVDRIRSMEGTEPVLTPSYEAQGNVPNCDANFFRIIDGSGGARNLIYATWLRSYESSSLAAKHVPRDVFFSEHHKVLDGIFQRGAQVKMAILAADPEVVLGWCVTAEKLVHYVYIKPAFRRRGIARALLAHIAPPFTYTHWTHVLRDLHDKVKDCVYNPYAVR